MNELTKNIFLVDDDIFQLEIMQQILRSSGIENMQAFQSGVSCLEQIHQNPDIIFLDHQMDEYSGYETLRKIKRYNPNIFVVMVSAQEQIKTAVDSLKHGAFDYIQKDDQLEDNIKNVLVMIGEVEKLIKKRKPSILDSFLNFI
jgi:DNA-binding NtrC family response regulator